MPSMPSESNEAPRMTCLRCLGAGCADCAGEGVVAARNETPAPKPAAPPSPIEALRLQARKLYQEQQARAKAVTDRAFGQECAITLAILRIRMDMPDLLPPGEFVAIDVQDWTDGAWRLPCLSLGFLGMRDKFLTRLGDKLLLVDKMGDRHSPRYYKDKEITGPADLGFWIPNEPEKPKKEEERSGG